MQGVSVLKTTQMLDLARERHGIPSDYALAKRLGVDQSTVTGYRRGRTKPENPVLARLCALCEIDFAHALLWLAMERADSEETRRTWRAIAEDFQATHPVPEWADERHFVAVDNSTDGRAKRVFSRLAGLL